MAPPQPPPPPGPSPRFTSGPFRYNAEVACFLLPTLLVALGSGGGTTHVLALLGSLLAYVFDLANNREARRWRREWRGGL